MAQDTKKKSLSKIIGGTLMMAAVISIFVIDWKPEVEEEPPLIRPLKTMVVGDVGPGGGRKYPGKVSANQEVDLSFEVPGKLAEIKVKKGDQVKQGALLARLDDRDYRNDLDSAEAELKRAQAQYERVKEAAAVQAVSQQDLTDAKAAYDKALATVRIKKKALEDTKIYARFDGVIANRFVENFENIQAKQPILSLQDVKNVEIRVNVPESRVAQSVRKMKGELKFTAEFDFLPGKEFDVALKEFTTEADPITQTFQATFVMPSPKEATILPGMTVTIVEQSKGGERKNVPPPTEFSVPLDAVPIDGSGQYYAWLVKPVEGSPGVFSVHRQDVEVGPMSGDNILIKTGLSAGDRMALAGVHLLQENQRVLLFQ
jgi:RND family efflux transporter MFP subunit